MTLEYGQSIKRVREAKGKTVWDVARHMGTDVGTVRSWEEGTYRITGLQTEKLAKYLEVTPKDFQAVELIREVETMSEVTAKTIMEQLKAPFPPESIHWRVGSTTKDKKSGLALAYLDARDVQDRLDNVVGPENWSSKISVGKDGLMLYELSLKINGEWITKTDGAGKTQVEGEKGGISDALKRAGVQWGIGRYLYGLTNVWVDLSPAGNSYKITPGQERKLKKALDGQAKPNPKPKPEPKPSPPAGPPRGNAGFSEGAMTVLMQGMRITPDIKKWWNDNNKMLMGTATPEQYEEIRTEANVLRELAKRPK